MFTWITDTVTAVGNILPMALEPPINYFIGLALLGGVVAMIRRFKR